MKRLVLRRQVVRQLEGDQVKSAQGGAQTTAISCGAITGCLTHYGCAPSVANLVCLVVNTTAVECPQG